MKSGDWTLAAFIQGLDLWIAVEDPSDDLRWVVTAWILSRAEDPYRGATRRDAQLPTLWTAVVPHTRHGDDEVVVVTYFVSESDHLVRCNQIGSLGLPIG